MLDGRPSSPKKIAKACSLGEEKTYMRDYVPGEVNEIQKIEFIHVKNIG